MVYKEASAIIDGVQKKKGTIKSLIYASKYKNIKQLYALVYETLRYASIIDSLIETTKLLGKEKWLGKAMAEVLVYEMLFGNGIQGNGKYRSAMKRYKSSLNSALARMKIKMGVVSNRDLLPASVKDEVVLPRYARVNTLKSTVVDVVNQFIEEGYSCIQTREQAEMAREEVTGDAQAISKLHTEAVQGLEPGNFMCDLHLDDLLVFPRGSDFHAHQLYKSGTIILQDKASCLPAFLLAPPVGSHVIDACAAPGNKTTHLAAILDNTGKVFAFDMDSKRLSVLAKMTTLAGATNVEATHQDFLRVDTDDEKYSCVSHILVDPSCSGSGIVSRADHLTDNGQSDSTERLDALAAVQFKLLHHALQFPCAERVVYSTCSVHWLENEGVVKDALAVHPEFRLCHAFPAWLNRGTVRAGGVTSSPEIDYKACLRADPVKDLTNGFFVAVLQRRHPPMAGKTSAVDARAAERTTDAPVANSGRARKRKRKKRKQKMVDDEPQSKEHKPGNGQTPEDDDAGRKMSRRRKRKRRKLNIEKTV